MIFTTFFSCSFGFWFLVFHFVDFLTLLFEFFKIESGLLLCLPSAGIIGACYYSQFMYPASKISLVPRMQCVACAVLYAWLCHKMHGVSLTQGLAWVMHAQFLFPWAVLKKNADRGVSLGLTTLHSRLNGVP